MRRVLSAAIPATVLLAAVAASFALVAAVASAPPEDDGDPFACLPTSRYALDGDGRTVLPGDPAAVVAAAQRDGTLPSGRFELDPTPPEDWRLRFRVVPDGEPVEAVVGDLERQGSGWRLAGYAHCR